MSGRGSKAGKTPSGRTTTPLMEFRAVADFRFTQHNSSPRAIQYGTQRERYYTYLNHFANQAVAANPQQFRITDRHASLRCLPRESWGNRGFRGRKVLFLLPMEALGENVATLMFLHAFAEAHGPARLGVFCGGSATDIYLTSDLVTVYPLWISHRDLKGWDVLIDLNQLETRRDIETWPVDMESSLLRAFGLDPSARYPDGARPLADGKRLNIGLLPLASSPLRTLPPSATLTLIEALADFGAVTLCLNRNQHQGRLYAQALRGRLPADVRVVDAFAAIGDLLSAIAAFDYAVFADSGPAHMSKLFGTPGVAVYSSAPGDVLQGRFTNLAAWHIPFEGAYCKAPCGLAKLRAAADGRIGCMGSLGRDLKDLPNIPRGADPAMVETLLLKTPVPCIASLAADPGPLAAFVRDDLERQCATL